MSIFSSLFNGAAVSKPALAEFVAFLETERPALIDALTDELVDVIPAYQDVPRDQLAYGVHESVGTFIAALDDAQLIAEWTRRRLQPIVEQGMELAPLLKLTSAYRQHFTGAALRAMQQDIAGAAEGLQMLGALADSAAQVVTNFYNERIHLYKTLIEQAPDAITVTDQQGRIVYINAAGARIHGYVDRAEITNIDESILFVPEEGERLRGEVTQGVQRDGRWQGRLSALRADGSRFPLHLAATSVFDHTGKQTGLALYSRDVTADYEAEQTLQRHADALKQANDRFEQSFATTPLITLEWDIDGTVRRWNPAAEKVFGWTAEEMIGQNVFTHIVPNIAAEQVQAIVDHLLAGNAANTNRNQNITRDGRLISCRWHNATLRDAEGHINGILSQAEDVTERMRQEGELRTFLALAENAPDAIGVARLDGPLIYANPAFVRQIGVRADGKATYVEPFAEDQVAVAHLTQTILEQGLWQGVRRFRRAGGGEFPGQLSGFLIRDADGNPQALAAIISDVSEQQRAEQERIALQEQIIQAQEAVLRELSTPLIPLADGVVAMPLIGSIDSRRALQVVEELLQGVTLHRASTAIVDITGVPVVDTQVAGALLRAAQAVELLGARVVLTGIRPEVAQTLVGIGVSLGNIVTRSTFQDGISHALRKR